MWEIFKPHSPKARVCLCLFRQKDRQTVIQSPFQRANIANTHCGILLVYTYNVTMLATHFFTVRKKATKKQSRNMTMGKKKRSSLDQLMTSKCCS